MVSAASVLASFHATQYAFQLLTTLQLTSYLWPKQSNVTDGDEYDFIVVGAGSAGSVVTARLVKEGYSVMLVEAGDDPPLEAVIPSLASYVTRSKTDWNFTTTVQEQCHRNNTMNVYTAQMISGSNGFNALMYVRGNPHDFQLWAEVVNDTTWSYDQVLTYFKKSEDLKNLEVLGSATGIYHGTNGPLQVIKINGTAALDGYFDAVAEIGHKVVQDFNGNDTLGYGNVMYSSTQEDGPRQSTAYAYLTPIKNDSNLHVLKKTLATKVNFDESNNAVSVEVITENNKTVTIKARKEIVFSAGALNSPKLLMLSGIGPNDHLQTLGLEVITSLPVGKNLQDQTGVLLQYLMEESDAPSPPPKNPHLTNPVDFFVGFAAVNKSQLYPDYATYNSVDAHDSTTTLASCSFFYGLRDDICQQLYDNAKGRTTLSTFLNVLQPKSRGEVLLNSTNPYDNAIIKLNFYSNQSDVETMVDAIEDFTRLSNTTYFKSVNASLLLLDLPGCADFEKGTREYWRCYVQCMPLASNHYAGTCAMGTVVDSRLRVYNVNRLRIVDASVMPVITCGNVNAPTIMIAEKAAAMIIEDHKS